MYKRTISPDDTESERFLHKKSLGQNFLTSDVVPTWMCDAGAVTTLDNVVEIGPGTGALTRVLLERGASVYAIETDARAISVLTETFAEPLRIGQLILIHADIQKFNWDTLPFHPQPYKVIANIPYFLSGWLLRTTLELPQPPATIVFLMQKEVVARVARAKKSSLLSLSVAVYGTPKYIKTVSRGHFNPAPNVDSAILAITNISHDHLPTAATRTHFFYLLHLGLGARRKQLLGALSHDFAREVVVQALDTLQVTQTVRGEDLSIAQWLQLAKLLPPVSPQ